MYGSKFLCPPNIAVLVYFTVGVFACVRNLLYDVLAKLLLYDIREFAKVPARNFDTSSVKQKFV